MNVSLAIVKAVIFLMLSIRNSIFIGNHWNIMPHNWFNKIYLKISIETPSAFEPSLTIMLTNPNGVDECLTVDVDIFISMTTAMKRTTKCQKDVLKIALWNMSHSSMFYHMFLIPQLADVRKCGLSMLMSDVKKPRPLYDIIYMWHSFSVDIGFNINIYCISNEFSCTFFDIFSLFLTTCGYKII